MADHKQDILTTTGSHRAWIGERAGENSNARAPLPLRSGAVMRDGMRNWNRPQNTNNNPRHAAITRSLANFPSYKSWTEKVKTNWKDKDKDKDKPE